jgi:hypothetical protein
MTPEAQRIAIAEACGWVREDTSFTRAQGWRGPKGDWYSPLPPDFLDDLNAMHEAESSIPQPSDFYRHNLVEVCGSEQQIHRATAAQRAEAFLRTLNLWTNDA